MNSGDTATFTGEKGREVRAEAQDLEMEVLCLILVCEIAPV